MTSDYERYNFWNVEIKSTTNNTTTNEEDTKTDTSSADNSQIQVTETQK